MSKVLSYRLAAESDMPLVREGFLDSYRTAHAAGLISMGNWHRVMSKEWQLILDRPGAEVFVAYHPGEESNRADLYGFIVVERDYLEDGKNPCPFVVYVYIKHNFRGKYGICRGLFRAASIDPAAKFHYACKTGVVGKFASKIPLAKWKPLPMRFPPKHCEQS